MAAEILIADDDAMVGELTNDLLSASGYRTVVLRESNLVLDAVREHRPKLIILDIMMPGIDGLKLLHAIKNDPSMNASKVIVLSAKSFPADRQRALDYGADAYVKKPYELEEFRRTVAGLIGSPESPAEPTGESKAVRVRLWGAGGPASCLSVEALGRLLVLDAGAGASGMEQPFSGASEAWALMSRFDGEADAELGLLPGLRRQNLELHLAGAGEADKPLAKSVEAAISRAFAVRPEPVTAKISLHELREDVYELAPGLRVCPFYANHPGTTLGYLLELAGRRIVYCPAGELYGESASALQDYDEKLGRLCRGADLLVHDARWSAADYEARKGQGHSSLENTVEFAAANEVQRLLLWAPDPSLDEAARRGMEQAAKALLESKGAELECAVAESGLAIEF